MKYIVIYVDLEEIEDQEEILAQLGQLEIQEE
jgi:hypothetical protein